MKKTTRQLMEDLKQREIRKYIEKNPLASNTELANHIGVNRHFFSGKYSELANKIRAELLAKGQGEDL